MDLISLKSELTSGRSNPCMIEKTVSIYCDTLIYLSYHNFTDKRPIIRIKDDIFYLDTNNIYITVLHDNLMYLSMSGIRGGISKIPKYIIYIGNDVIKILDLPKYLIYLTCYWSPHYAGNVQNLIYAAYTKSHSTHPQYIILNGISKRFNIQCKK